MESIAGATTLSTVQETHHDRTDKRVQPLPRAFCKPAQQVYSLQSAQGPWKFSWVYKAHMNPKCRDVSKPDDI